jgi:prolyl-tRNA synthetase
MIFSKQILQEKLRIPINYPELETYKLISEAGFVTFPYAGFPFFLPIGQRLVRNIQRIIEDCLTQNGFSQVYAPLIQNKEYLLGSGRYQNVKNELFNLTEPFNNFFLTPTNEEFFLKLLGGNLSYRSLPVKFFQIADKFRNIKKPKGILRSKQFLMCDAISIDASAEELLKSSASFEVAVKQVFDKLDINVVRCEKDEGKYVDYLILCPEGETKLIQNAQGIYEFSSEHEKLVGSSVAMYFTLNSDSMYPTFYTDNDSIKKTVSLGTYGFGIQRCLHALIHQHRDQLGINFPKSARLFEVSILPIDTRSTLHLEESHRLYNSLHEKGYKIALDDRRSMSLGARASYSDFLGTPLKIFIGDNEIKNRNISIKKRNGQSARSLKVDEILNIPNPLFETSVL